MTISSPAVDGFSRVTKTADFSRSASAGDPPVAGAGVEATWRTGLAQAQMNTTKLENAHRQWVAQLTPQEKTALRAYRTPGVYYLLNQFLRHKNGRIPQQRPWQRFDAEGLRNLAYHLDSALRKAPKLKEPITVFRSVVLPNRFTGQWSRLKGQFLEDRGFMSTTIDPKVIANFEHVRLANPKKAQNRRHDPICAAITVPAGTSMAYIEVALGGKGEREVLFPIGQPHGQALRFTSNVETVDGIPMATANFVEDGARANWNPAFPPGFKPGEFVLSDYFKSSGTF